MDSIETKYDGYYQNVDTDTKAITQLHFARSGDDILVNAWGRCHPEDCEWGPATLFLLDASDDETHQNQAFASWGTAHCHFVPTENGISCSHFSVHTQPKTFGYRINLNFVPGQPDRILEADSLFDYQTMWDGTEPGWKLVQFTQPVFTVEFHFNESGPNQLEFETLKEFVANPFEDDKKWWDALRECTGTGIAKPIDLDRLKLLHSHQIRNNLNLTIRTIANGDYLYLSPNGNYATWCVNPDDHSAVVNKMLECNIEIETRSVP